VFGRSVRFVLMTLLFYRRKTAIDDIAVKPITQFPVSLAEEVSFSRFDID
jgi:hypothetical protein